jgi:hypothetical protein
MKKVFFILSGLMLLVSCATKPVPKPSPITPPFPGTAKAMAAAAAAAVRPPGPLRTNVFTVTINWFMVTNNPPWTNYMLEWGTNLGAYQWKTDFSTAGRSWPLTLTNYHGSNAPTIAAWYFRLTGSTVSGEGRYPQWPANKVRLNWSPPAWATVQAAEVLGSPWLNVAQGTNAILNKSVRNQFFRAMTTNGPPVTLTLSQYYDPGQPSKGVQSVTLAWSPSADTNVIGYNVYHGIASRTYTHRVDVGPPLTCTISNLLEGVCYYFAATAYNILGMESDYSNECGYCVPTQLIMWVLGP